MKRRLPFTTLELVMVITIAAILLAISLPAFYNISGGRRLTAAMTAITANVSLARARAVSENEYMALIFNGSGDAMRLARIHRNRSSAVITFSFQEWLDGSSWETIEDGVVIPTGQANFFEGNPEDSPGTAMRTIASVDFSDLTGGGTSVTASRAIVFSPRGQIVTQGAPVTPIVIRVAEGTRPPGADSYTLKKTGTEVNYGRLTLNPLSCRADVDFLSE